MDGNHTTYGVVSLTLSGVITYLMFLYFHQGIPLEAIYSFVQLPFGLFAIILGAVAYWGKDRKDAYGLVGFALGIVMLIFGFLIFGFIIQL
ncbi:MAG: hypothetical protein KKC68_05320 [Candidatus Thermoplasmatota archaeon]|nr:hypothetical protein [Candidatus Thermoplasmatota archaeon]MBU1941175.1 hypothetical protein [Candidatus Thermoplasmatota archaeon]